MISIQTNVAALYGLQNLQKTQMQEQNTIEQMTSGFRINTAADDPAGLAQANQLRNMGAVLTQGVANGNNAVGQLQIIDGGLNNISQILDRLQTLATEGASSTFTGNFGTLASEFVNDVAEITRQASNIGLNSGGNFQGTALTIYVGGGLGNNNGISSALRPKPSI
jgi:flagellin